MSQPKASKLGLGASAFNNFRHATPAAQPHMLKALASSMSTKQKRTVGSVITIPIDGYCVHAQILDETDIVVFDTRDKNIKTASDVVSQSVLFRVSANSDAILSGAWLKLGKAALNPTLSQPVPRFIQNALNPNKFEIYLGGNIEPAKKEECLNLDRCAVWAVNHIEDRIRDHYNNQPNIWLEQMRLKC